MKPLSNYFTDTLSTLSDLQPHSFFLIHGICANSELGKPIIELRITRGIPLDVIPSLLFSSFSLYSRCADNALYIIIDIRNCSEDCLFEFLGTLRPYQSWLKGTIKCAIWVIESLLPNLENALAEDLIFSHVKNIFSDVDSLSCHVGTGNFSTALKGSYNDELSQQFYTMRTSLEGLVRKTHKIAKLYMKMHEELKEFEVPHDLASVDVDVVKELAESLNNRWNTLREDPDMVYLRANGKALCIELQTQFPMLQRLDSYLYSDAVTRAVTEFEEVSVVMQKSDSGIVRRLHALRSAAEAIHFFAYVKKAALSIESIVEDIEQLKSVKIFSVVRLTAQVKQIENKTMELNEKLEEASDYLDSVEHLLEEGSFGEADRLKLSSLCRSFKACIYKSRQRVLLVHDVVQAALDSRTLINQVYEWALLHAKRSDDNQDSELLIVTYPHAAIERLKKYVGICTNEVVSEEIKKLVSDCDKAIKELTSTKNTKSGCQLSASSSQDSHGSVDGMSPEIGSGHLDSCLSGEGEYSVNDLSFPKSPSDYCDSISDTPMEMYSDSEEGTFEVHLQKCHGKAVEHRSISPALTQYEIPISKAATSREQQTKDSSYIEEIRWRRNSWAPASHSETLEFVEESAIGAAPVTLDMTNKVITTMSTNTLHKRLDQRRSISTVPSRLPNPFLINGAARPGSARFILSQKSRRPLMRTSSTDFLEQDCRSALSAFQFLDDDYCSLVDSPLSSLGSAAALSALDFSLRSEQIDMIREWLSPAKTSDANFRIECTVVRDLLDSEIEYVSSLRNVVQDFLPEMARVDIPSELRGKKLCIFGNIEKLFQFHAHSFLPQLISRLRFRNTEESVSMTIGKLFMDNLNHFELYALYSKNKPKSDQLMRECGHKFFSSVQSMADLSHLLSLPIERISKYALAVQQLLNAALPTKVDVLEILEKVANVVGHQIRRGADLLAMERITGCDLNLKEQGNLLRHDTMYVMEKRGLQSKKRVRSVFLFENCVVLTKPKLMRTWKGCGTDELKYKASIQMTDCGLTEMVKQSRVKFELWFRKQKSSFTYVLEAQTALIRDAWVEDIRNILWAQAIRSREKNLREKAKMGVEPHSAYISFGHRSTLSSFRDFGVLEGCRRPRSLISLTASSCSSSNNFGRMQGRGTCEIGGDLCRVEEGDEWENVNDTASVAKSPETTLPRFRAPPPPSDDVR